MNTTLRLYTSHEHTVHESNHESAKFDFTIPLSCPHCGTTKEHVNTWGTYPTSKG